MSISGINKLSRASQLSLVGVVILLGAVLFTVNNAMQQQNTSSRASGANTVSNSGFESGTGSWQFNLRDGSATYSTTTSTKVQGDSSAQIKVTDATSNPWEIEIAQYGKSVTAGKTYTVSYWAKASVNRSMDVVIQNGNSPYTEILRRTSSLTTTWRQYTYTFQSSQTLPNAFVGLQFGDARGTVWVDEVKFVSGIATQPTSTPTSTPIPPTPTPTPTPRPATALSVNKSTARPGEQITATWANIANPTPRDFIALHTPSSANSNYIGWIYVNCTQSETTARASGSCTFPLPDSTPAGKVELRLHANDGNTILASSQLITIIVPATSTPIPTAVPPTPTPTKTPTATLAPTARPTTVPPTSTPVPGSTLATISVFLHGIGKGGDSANPNAQGNNNPLRQQRTVSVDVFDSQNQLVITKQGTVAFNSTTGNFVGDIDLGTQFNTGVYTVKVKTDQYLRGLLSGIQTITKGQSNILPGVTLIAGDVNGDNQINIIDYNLLTGCYSDLLPAVDCTPTNKLLTDFNDDGNTNQFDYNLFLRELTNIGGQ